MQIITPTTKPFDELLTPQKLTDGVHYRPMHFVVEQAVDEGLLLYHNLTRSLILLSNNETLLYRNNPASLPELISLWFLVPEDHDDNLLSHQMRHIAKLFERNDDAITSYTIFTTTDCNARCFYCYEKGRPRIPMTLETAERTADYIIRYSAGHKVNLNWFGGEPLYNQRVISFICKRLRESDIGYQSAMTSNGYLFSDQLVRKAVDLWQLKRVQITLDGTEKIYNDSKAYIYKNVNAYKRVIANIHRLLVADIEVNIRLNADLHNVDNLSELTDELHREFGQKRGLSVYIHQLFEQTGSSTAETREVLFHKMQEINIRLAGYGLARKNNLKGKVKPNCCMADNDSCITILPTGKIGKCEHYTEDHFIGHIDTGKQWDSSIVAAFHEPYLYDACRTCFYEPDCVTLKLCEIHSQCHREERDYLMWGIRQSMLHTYRATKKENKAEDDKIQD